MSGAEELLRELAGPCIVVAFFCGVAIARLASCFLGSNRAPNTETRCSRDTERIRMSTIQLEQDWPSLLVHFPEHDSRQMQ